MQIFDPFGEATFNTAAALYPCWECELCDPPPEYPQNPWGNLIDG